MSSIRGECLALSGLVETKSGDVVIRCRGYHEELGGLLIVDGEPPPQVELREAVAGLHWLVDEFSFQGEGDRSRALAAFLTPALRLGGSSEWQNGARAD